MKCTFSVSHFVEQLAKQHEFRYALLYHQIDQVQERLHMSNMLLVHVWLDQLSTTIFMQRKTYYKEL